MVSIRLSVRPGVNLGFRTSTNEQDFDGWTGPGLEIEVQVLKVLKSRSGDLPRVNTKVFFFFFPPFSDGLPKVNTRVFFFFFVFCPFPAGSLCRRLTCPGLILGFFFFSSPFSSGLPRVNIKVFSFFFLRPFQRNWGTSQCPKVMGTH